MKLTVHMPVATDERVYTLTISGGDLARVKLSGYDRRVLADCNGAEATISDRLLGLELLARRIEETP